jgi:mitogen-activated protein kinase kinase
MERENSSQPVPDLDALAAEKGRPLEVDDLDEAGWRAASGKGMIEELGSLGEGAGGAVTKSRLKGGKTTFALKVCTSLWVEKCLLICFSRSLQQTQIPM